MQTLNDVEVREWCEARGLKFGDDGWPLPFVGGRVLRVMTEGRPYDVALLMNQICGSLQEVAPGDILLWVKETGIWDPRVDAIGLRQLDLLQRGGGQSPDIGERRGQIFSKDELVDCAGMSILPVVYGWDAYLVSHPVVIFVYISHDEYIDVAFKDPDDESVLREWFGMFEPSVRAT